MLLSIGAHAQKFITPLESGVPPAQECYVVTNEGERIEGKTRFVVSASRGIKTISLKLTTGDHVKFTADKLKEIGFKNNGLTRLMSADEQTSSIKKMLKADWDQIQHQEYIVYTRVSLPSGKPVMMQLINPAFASRIQVYYSMGSRKTSGIGIPLATSGLEPTTIKLTGGRQRAYWVAKDNGRVFKLKRGNYNKKQFKRLFGDAPEMQAAFGRPYKFREFSAHVYFYEELQRRKK